MSNEPRSHWIEYGEPTGNGRVEATKRTTYHTGPNNSRDDDVIHGTVSFETVDIIEGHKHQHDDGSLLLSEVDNDKRETINEDFVADTE